MKKILVLSLVLALLLTLVLPSVAMAAKPSAFSATGVMTSIDVGNVRELGHSGNWLVADRHIAGQFLPVNPDGTPTDISGPFVLTYGGVFKLADQSGNLLGTLVSGSGKFIVTGKVDPYVLIGWYVPNVVPVLESAITGHWVYIAGGKGEGTFSAKLDFIPTADGHVYAVLPSSFFTMEGKSR